MKIFMEVCIRTNYRKHIFNQIYLIKIDKMVLIQLSKDNNLNFEGISSKNRRNIPKEEYNGGFLGSLFSGIAKIATPAINFAKTNSDLIKTGVTGLASVTSAGKNIADIVNSTKKNNAEIQAIYDNGNRDLELYKKLQAFRNSTKTKTLPSLVQESTPIPQSKTITNDSALMKIANKKSGKGIKIY